MHCSGSQGATRSSCWKESRWVLAIAYMSLIALLFFKTIRIPAVEILNGQARYGQPIGVLPKHCRPIVGLHPMYCIGSEDVETMAGMAVMPVAKRLAKLSERDDFFNKLPVKDEHGQLMGREEITAEALGLLVAGFDTTSQCVSSSFFPPRPIPFIVYLLHSTISIAAIVYYIFAIPKSNENSKKNAHISDTRPVSYDLVKNLPLHACINKGIRLFSTEGDPSDVELYRPERWLEAHKETVMNRAFIPFSVGPRAGIGRNVAMLEMVVVIVYEYDFVLEKEDQELHFKEGLTS
ncbi:hypothetical protein D9758_008544 [Tetrapyrgos nigripes]|uniref:Uncharacterized protein n=1 Tax=Tetrapyrgos nigripes TaxID=182062 RepID=A0A8H5LIY8_9AGAR|nr:hypothetical protein D9758_008544 [Tetrapyrgos nigripes]